MKKLLIIHLLLITSLSYAQKNSNWVGKIIEPDLFVLFPDTPKIFLNKGVYLYEYINSEFIMRVTSEKSPLNYYGRTIEEVESEYYDSLNDRILNRKQKILTEEDFKFENHKVRKLVYLDTINNQPCTVTLEILNVTGFEEAMYKFYFIDFKQRPDLPKVFENFFLGWDLYYKFENQINEKETNKKKLFEDNGFKVEFDEPKSKKIIAIFTALLLFLTIIIIRQLMRKSARS